MQHVFLGFLLLLCGCAQAEPQPATLTPFADGWSRSEPEDEGFDPTALAETISFIEDDAHGDFRSLVVARNGRLVLDQYFNGHGPDSLNDIRSAAKSITSTLVGIALAEGLIPNETTPVLSLFPGYMPVSHDEAGKRAITVEHLLTMASGLDANADDPASPGYEDRMWESEEWVRFVLDLPMANPPGETWMYASANSFLLGAAVEDASGQTLEAYAEQKLFAPLGMTRYAWAETPTGRTVGQGNLWIRARDMAKIGQLYLNGGRWEGEQVVPEDWIRRSVEERYPVPWQGYDHYGYGWYTHELEVRGRMFSYFLASGNGGNKIYVFPEEQMVVVTQSAAYNTGYGQRRSFEILKRVLAAVDES